MKMEKIQKDNQDSQKNMKIKISSKEVGQSDEEKK